MEISLPFLYVLFAFKLFLFRSNWTSRNQRIFWCLGIGKQQPPKIFTRSSDQSAPKAEFARPVSCEPPRYWWIWKNLPYQRNPLGNKRCIVVVRTFPTAASNSIRSLANNENVINEPCEECWDSKEAVIAKNGVSIAPPSQKATQKMPARLSGVCFSHHDRPRITFTGECIKWWILAPLHGRNFIAWEPQVLLRIKKTFGSSKVIFDGNNFCGCSAWQSIQADCSQT